MPKAAIDEDGEFEFREGEAGFQAEGLFVFVHSGSSARGVTTPAGEAVCAHDRDQSQVRVAVAVRTDGGRAL